MDEFLGIMLGTVVLILGALLVLLFVFLWVAMIIDAAKNRRWVWLFVIIFFELIGTIVYMIVVYKKSPIEEYLIKPFKQGYKTSTKKK